MPNADTDAPAAVGRSRPALTRREGLLALVLLAPAGLLAACSGSAFGMCQGWHAVGTVQ
jgi:hypothetical protein